MQYSFQSSAHWSKIKVNSLEHQRAYLEYELLKNTGQVVSGPLNIKAPHKRSDLSDRVHIRLIYISDLQRKQNS